MRFRTIIIAAAVPAATAGLLLTTTAAASARHGHPGSHRSSRRPPDQLDGHQPPC